MRKHSIATTAILFFLVSTPMWILFDMSSSTAYSSRAVIGCCASIVASWDWSFPHELSVTTTIGYGIENVTLNSLLVIPSEVEVTSEGSVHKFRNLTGFHRNKLYELRINGFHNEDNYYMKFISPESYVVACGHYGYAEPEVRIEVSPPGYPEVGADWRVQTYFATTRMSRDRATTEERIPVSGADVVMSVHYTSDRRTISYSGRSNEDGICAFERRVGDAVVFSAEVNVGGRILKSDEFVVSSGYISSDIPFLLTQIPLPTSLAVLALGSKRVKKNALAKLQFLLLVAHLCAAVTLNMTGLYWVSYKKTYWGYPIEIWNGLTSDVLVSLLMIWSALVSSDVLVYLLKRPIDLRASQKHK